MHTTPANGTAMEKEAGSWAQTFSTSDIDAHAAAQGGWALRYEQLSSGSFQGELTLVHLEGLHLFGERTNLALRQRGKLGDDVYGFAMSQTDRDDVYFDGQRVAAHGIMCGRARAIDLVMPMNHGLLAMVVSRELLNPLWERMYQKPLAAWLEHQLVLQPSDVCAIALRQKHTQILHEAMSLVQRFPDPSCMRPLRDDILIEWIEALPPSVDVSDLDTLARRKRLVDKACELMLSHTDEPLSILDICTRVGASRRKLNYSFQDVLGTSPTKYLRALRLNGVRRELRRGGQDTTVQDVAARWGFWHLGQFSLDYKKHFFELPSETLSSARRG